MECCRGLIEILAKDLANHLDVVSIPIETHARLEGLRVKAVQLLHFLQGKYGKVKWWGMCNVLVMVRKVSLRKWVGTYDIRSPRTPNAVHQSMIECSAFFSSVFWNGKPRNSKNGRRGGLGRIFHHIFLDRTQGSQTELDTLVFVPCTAGPYVRGTCSPLVVYTQWMHAREYERAEVTSKDYIFMWFLNLKLSWLLPSYDGRCLHCEKLIKDLDRRPWLHLDSYGPFSSVQRPLFHGIWDGRVDSCLMFSACNMSVFGQVKSSEEEVGRAGILTRRRITGGAAHLPSN